MEGNRKKLGKAIGKGAGLFKGKNPAQVSSSFVSFVRRVEEEEEEHETCDSTELTDMCLGGCLQMQKQEDDVRQRMSHASDAFRRAVLDAQSVRQEYFNSQLPKILRVSSISSIEPESRMDERERDNVIAVFFCFLSSRRTSSSNNAPTKSISELSTISRDTPTSLRLWFCRKERL